jgi:multidrug efflux pump subunit AcrA (membrane-fusion protein)
LRTIQTFTQIICIGIIALLFSCNSSHSNDYFTYKINRSPFKEQIQITGELEPIKTITIFCPNLRSDAIISYLIPNGTVVKKGDIICKLQCHQLDNQYSIKLQDLEIQNAELSKIQANQNLQLQLLQAQKQTIEASTSIKMLDTIQEQFISQAQKKLLKLELQKAKIELDQIKSKIQSLKKINKSEVNSQKLKIKQAEMQLNSSKQLLDQLVIKASSDGVALRAKRYRSGPSLVEGDAVWRRMPLVKISNTSEFLVKFNLPEGVYKTIKKEDPFTGVISSIPNSRLNGSISQKAPMGKPISKDSKVKLFDVSAKIDSLNMTPKPGLTVICKVFTQNIDSALTVPLVAIHKSDSSQYVYTMHKNNEFIKKEIKISYKSASLAVIEEGIKEGDVVSLHKPDNRSITSTEKL